MQIESCTVVWKSQVGRYRLSEIYKPSMGCTIVCITYYDKDYYFSGWGMGRDRITESQISWMFDCVGKKNFATNCSFAEFCINYKSREEVGRMNSDKDFDLNPNLIRYGAGEIQVVFGA